MKKIMLSISAVAVLSLSFSGCGASNGLGLGSASVKKVFETGTIESSQKVLVSKDMMATVTGAGIGAVAGYVGGYLMDGNEKPAFQIEILSKKGQTYTAYLENELPLNSEIEFVVRDGKEITNIDVKKIGTPKEIIVEKQVIKEKIIEKPVYKTKEIIKEKVVEKPVYKEVIKEVKVPVPPVSEKAVEESTKKVETNNVKTIW